MYHSFFEQALKSQFGSEFRPHGIVHRLNPPAASDFAYFTKIVEIALAKLFPSDYLPNPQNHPNSLESIIPTCALRF